MSLDESALGRYLAGIAAGIMIGSGTVSGINNYREKIIPEVSQVQQDYVAPANIRIKLEDLDFNEEKETILSVDEKPYLFMYDSDHKPTLRSYEIVPAKIEIK